MKTQQTPTRHPRILAAMALTLAISAVSALAEPDQPQPPTAKPQAALAAKKEGGPHVVMVVTLHKRSSIYFSGIGGEDFWFKIQKVHRFHCPEREDLRAEAFSHLMRDRAANLKAHHMIQVEVRGPADAIEPQVQAMAEATEGHELLIIACPVGACSFTGTQVDGFWGSITKGNLCVLPFTEENLANIDELYAKWRKTKPLPRLMAKPMTPEDIKKGVSVPAGFGR